MRNFNYHRPADVAAASAQLAKSEEPRLLAGGMSLLPSMKLRLVGPSDIVDLGDIASLRGVKVEGKEVFVGAMIIKIMHGVPLSCARRSSRRLRP